jgi:transposase
VQISRLVTEWLLPMRECPCCGQVTTAAAPPGVHAGTISYGLRSTRPRCCLRHTGTCPPTGRAPDRHAAGHAGVARVRGQGQHPAGRDAPARRVRRRDAGRTGAEPALGADETPVNVLTPDNDPQTGEPETGSPHVLVIRTPGGNLTWLRALGSRRAEAITTILGFFTGFLITDGYTAYQQLLPKLAGIQQCAAHVIRRCRAVAGLGPGSLQSWAADIIEILREAHHLTEQAQARDGPGDAEPLAKLRERYDEAIAFGITHNRHRDWHDGNHPATSSAAGCATTPARSGCSPASPPSTGPTTAPSAAPRQPSGTRPSPDTGTTSAPSPGGTASAATSTPPPRTA